METSNIIIRLLILLLIAYLITSFIFAEVKKSTVITHTIEDVDQNKNEYFEGQIGTFGSSFENISSLIKVPISLLNFNIYLENYRKAKIKNTGEEVLISINIDIKGNYEGETNYEGGIKYGDRRRVATSTRGQEIPRLAIERAFEVQNKKEISIEETVPLKGTYYSLFIEPTKKSWLLIYFFVGIPFSYAFFIILNSCRRFILFGSPFTDNKN